MSKFRVVKLVNAKLVQSVAPATSGRVFEIQLTSYFDTGVQHWTFWWSEALRVPIRTLQNGSVISTMITFGRNGAHGMDAERSDDGSVAISSR
jgi:hypothetical protein